MTVAGSRILSQTDVRLSDAPVRVGESSAAIAAAMGGVQTDAEHSHVTELSVDQDAVGNVVRIHIRCLCGENITISCDYPDAA